jgi:carbon-monoxide dehydrogenase large subunit
MSVPATTRNTVNGKYVGAPVRRVNDRKFITGAGRFVDDIQMPGTLHAIFVRSPHAHAEIAGVDASIALAAPGVVTVLTGEDMRQNVRPVVSAEPALPGRTLSRLPLTVDRARFAGDAVAIVVAESAHAARDAVDLVEVEYRELPAVTSAEIAMADGAPLLYPEWDSNVVYHWSVEAGEVDEVFERATHHVKISTRNQRIASVFIEPRAILASHEPQSDEMTVWASTQVPHTLRTAIATALDYLALDPRRRARCRGRLRLQGRRVYGVPGDRHRVVPARPAGQVGRDAQRAFPGHEPRARPGAGTGSSGR